MKSFEQRWREMPTHSESPGFQRVDESHAIDFYLGKEASGEWVLLLISDERPKPSREYRAIHVISRERHDGRWALLFRLMSAELEKLFSLLCEDLVESSRGIKDATLAASFVLARFARWQKLLERGSDLLDESALLGLIGELLFLEKQVIPSKGLRDGVNGWVGPAGAERDFRFGEREYEVKTVGPTAKRVLISSAEQLDIPDNRLDLFVVSVEETLPGSHPEAFTPLDLIARLKDSFESDSAAFDLFDSKLLEAGFIPRDEYAERAYRFHRFRGFHVRENFPAIRRSGLPQGIGKVLWELELTAVASFEFSPATI